MTPQIRSHLEYLIQTDNICNILVHLLHSSLIFKNIELYWPVFRTI